jgi:hypothetical protein
MVPSLDALTPDPAFALVAPAGSTSAGQTFKHAAVHAVLLGFKVYSVLPLTRMVPTLAFLVVETVTPLAAPASEEATTDSEIPPTATIAPTHRAKAALWSDSRF